MNTAGFNYRILVVDDEPGVLQTSALVLKHRGFEVRTAKDGFEALVELRRSTPDMIISDLKMPHMSGFELLSVVRRRFPHIPVIAISGEYSGDLRGGVIADAFFVKGQYSPEELFNRIAELIEQSPVRPHFSKPDRAPVWVPRNAEGYFVVTCTECLRSASVPDEEIDEKSEMRNTTCLFCGTTIQYLADLRSVRKKRSAAARPEKAPREDGSEVQ